MVRKSPKIQKKYRDFDKILPSTIHRKLTWNWPEMKSQFKMGLSPGFLYHIN